MKKILLCAIALLFTAGLFAQDKIYKKNGSVVSAKVLEIGPDEVKYRLTDAPDGPIYVVDKATLKKIEYADGRVEKYQINYKDPVNYEGQLNKAIKINFFAPLLGYSEVSFEKSLSPLKGYELNLGIIGAGKNTVSDSYYINGIYEPYKRNAFGFFVDGGYKFKKLPTFFSRGTRMSHIMQGNYIKPTATIGYYTDHAVNYKSSQPVLEKRNNAFGALTLNFGQQWIFADRFLLDAFVGLGYAFDNHKNDNYDYYSELYNHFVVQTNGSGNLGVTFGLKVGLLIK